VRTKLRNFGVFSLSAIDLFASAMGAFIIITIILMPDYQKEVRLEGHLQYIESLAGQTDAMLNESQKGVESTFEALQSARSRELELQAEEEIMSSELEALRARLQARSEHAPPPPPSPEETDEDTGSNLVTFRFLGLKTDRTRLLLMIDMNKYLAEHEQLVTRTVARALDSLQKDYQFAILGFQQLDSGPTYHRWPRDGSLAPMNNANRAQALRYLRSLSGQFQGASSMQAAFGEAFESPADAIILISDGLPNPTYNGGLPPRALIQDIVMSNTGNKEIHAVTIGDYFKYRGTVDFMENLARANGGGFLALAQ
jgi:hypothetical protein